MESNGFRRRSLAGQKTPLRNGGWLLLRPRIDNIDYHEKMRRLGDEIRQARGVDSDANLLEILSNREFTEYIHRAQIGTVIMGWGAFDREDGQEVPCRLPDGSLDEDAGLEVLLSPGVGHDFLEAIEPIDDAHRRRRELIEKNSLEPSVGTSDTQGSTLPTPN